MRRCRCHSASTTTRRRSGATIFAAIVVGFAIGPVTLVRMMRLQSNALQEGCHMALDAWYLMFGKAQALTIPKDAMTPEQQAEFGEFIKAELVKWARIARASGAKVE